MNNNSLSLRERVGERGNQTTLDVFNLPQPGSLP